MSKSDEDSKILSEELSWRFLGLRIARKTEILALAAFFLSVSGLLWQILNYVRGPVVRLFPSDQIIITSSGKLGKNYAGQPDLLALIATFAYVNEGDVGHNAVVRREYIKFEFGDRKIEHRWYLTGSSDFEGSNPTFKPEGEARPFPVTAGSAVSHDTLFAAWEIDCEQVTRDCNPAENFVVWDDFVKTIKLTKEIKIKTVALIYSKPPAEATCEIRLRDWEISIIEMEGWLAAACAADADARLQRSARPQKHSS
jgi:hypothetical protein